MNKNIEESRYDKLYKLIKNDNKSISSNSENSNVYSLSNDDSSEMSPLLKAFRHSKQDGSYKAIPIGSDGLYTPRNSENSIHSIPSVHSFTFQPIIYAEKAFERLLNGILLYVFFCIMGLGLLSLKFEGMIHNSAINWWIIFLPFWTGNFILWISHMTSFKATKELKKWAEMDTLTNEPLLPLLRKIFTVYFITIPLSILLLWSEIGFCTRLQNSHSVSIYFCFIPILMIETVFVCRYFLCRSSTHLPGISWFLIFIFTFLLTYQLNNFWDVTIDNETYLLPWWIVFFPLFCFDGFMILSIIFILFKICTGIFRIAKWQITTLIMYGLFLICTISGQILLFTNIEITFHNNTIIIIKSNISLVPSSLIFFGLVCGSIGIYMVSLRYVALLMLTRGGAIPVPLTRTNAGWITNGSFSEQWLLLGQIYYTDKGINQSQIKNKKDEMKKQAETDSYGRYNEIWYRCFRNITKLFSKNINKGHYSLSSSSELESINKSKKQIKVKINSKKNVPIKRKNSGSYADLASVSIGL